MYGSFRQPEYTPHKEKCYFLDCLLHVFILMHVWHIVIPILCIQAHPCQHMCSYWRSPYVQVWLSCGIQIHWTLIWLVHQLSSKCIFAVNLKTWWADARDLDNYKILWWQLSIVEIGITFPPAKDFKCEQFTLNWWRSKYNFFVAGWVKSMSCWYATKVVVLMHQPGITTMHALKTRQHGSSCLL